MSKICKKCDTLITFGDNNYCELCANELVADLEAKLRNAIFLQPDRYVIVNNWWKKKKYGIAKVHQQVLDSYSIQTGYMGDVSPCFEYGEFATFEEAEEKLKQLTHQHEDKGE